MIILLEMSYTSFEGYQEGNGTLLMKACAEVASELHVTNGCYPKGTPEQYMLSKCEKFVSNI